MMKSKMLKNVLSMSLFTAVSIGLVGCGDDTPQQPKKIVKVQQKSKQQTGDVFLDMPRTKFRYDWLSGVESSNTVDTEEIMFDENYYFIIDGSGSMEGSSCDSNERKIDVAKRAVISYVQTLPAEVNVGLLAFDSEGITERFPLSKTNRSEFYNQVNAIKYDSSTPLKTAMNNAYEKIQEQAVAQHSHGVYNMIIVTDGEADKGQDPTMVIRKIGYESPVNITTIGFCIGSNHSLNNENFVNYYAASSYEDIMSGLQEVQAEGENMSEEDLIQNLNDLSEL